MSGLSGANLESPDVGRSWRDSNSDSRSSRHGICDGKRNSCGGRYMSVNSNINHNNNATRRDGGDCDGIGKRNGHGYGAV